MKKMYILPIAGLFFLNSCRSSDTENNLSGSNLSGVSFNMGVNDFEGGADLTPQASLKSNAGKPEIIRQEIASGPFSITAELSQDAPSSRLQTQASAGQGTMAVDKSLSLRGAVRYRIVAYKADGTYIDQAVGDASQANQVFFGDKLTKGQTYNFVIYSLGSTTVDPPVAPTTNLNLASVNLNFSSYTEDTSDLMWMVEPNITINGTPGDSTPPTPLTHSLRHIFSRVNILVDNSDDPDGTGPGKGGYLSEKPILASVTSPMLYSTSSLNLRSSAVTGGTYNYTGFVTNDINTSRAYIINTSGIDSGGSLGINVTVPAGAIKVGNDVNPNPVTFSFVNNLSGQTRGYSYTIKLRINSDRYVNASNVTRNATDSDALYAIIGGKRWDRYNLGVPVAYKNPALYNPDDINTYLNNPNVFNGSMYQWGTNIAIDTNNPIAGQLFPGWNTTGVTDNQAWNSGTSLDPIKTASDPCPSGSRLPAAFDSLLDDQNRLKVNTNVSFVGQTPISGNNITENIVKTATVATSKKNTLIKLTFPVVGRRDGRGMLFNRNSIDAEHWSSTANLNNSSYAFGVRVSGIGNVGSAGGDRIDALPIRCVQDKTNN